MSILTMIPSTVGMVVKIDQLLEVLATTLIFVFIGILFFAIAYGVLGFMYPIKKEIEEDHNTALAIVIGSIMLGLALIISAAIQG